MPNLTSLIISVLVFACFTTAITGTETPAGQTQTDASALPDVPASFDPRVTPFLGLWVFDAAASRAYIAELVLLGRHDPESRYAALDEAGLRRRMGEEGGQYLAILADGRLQAIGWDGTERRLITLRWRFDGQVLRLSEGGEEPEEFVAVRQVGGRLRIEPLDEVDTDPAFLFARDTGSWAVGRWTMDRPRTRQLTAEAMQHREFEGTPLAGRTLEDLDRELDAIGGVVLEVLDSGSWSSATRPASGTPVFQNGQWSLQHGRVLLRTARAGFDEMVVHLDHDRLVVRTAEAPSLILALNREVAQPAPATPPVPSAPAAPPREGPERDRPPAGVRP
jgi:hypothetical protein